MALDKSRGPKMLALAGERCGVGEEDSAVVEAEKVRAGTALRILFRDSVRTVPGLRRYP